MRVAAAALLLQAALLAGPPEGVELPWPMLRRGPGATASCAWDPPGAGAIPEWHYVRLAQRKYRDGIPVWTSPALCLVEGRPMAFVGGCDQTLHALDLADKQRRWLKVTNGPITCAPAIGSVDGLPVVFFTSADRTVYAHFASNGLRLWSRELVEPTSTMGVSRYSSPLLHGDRLFVAGFVYDKAPGRSRQQAWLFGLEAHSGALRFRIEVSQGPVSSPVGKPIDGHFLVYVAARKGRLTCLDCTGDRPSVRWTYQMPHEVLGSPALARAGGREVLFLGSKFGNLIALDARTGKVIWKRMAGNWIDNTVCVGDVDGEPTVFAGSHDYKVYAIDAASGTTRWAKHLGGEVFAAPALFHVEGRPLVAACCLDDHAYVLDARTGRIVTSYYTGAPLWDKISKGDVLWGSPAVLEAGQRTAIVFGAYSGTVYVLPVLGECSLRAKAWSPGSLWIGLLVVLVVFLAVVVPLALRHPPKIEAP